MLPSPIIDVKTKSSSVGVKEAQVAVETADVTDLAQIAKALSDPVA